MNTIPLGCQTYTWQMSYKRYSQKLDHIMDVVSKAGFSGIEPEICMLGPYTEQPQKLSDDLESRNLKLAALCLVCDWLGKRESETERKEADRVIDYLKIFPETVLVLCQMPQVDRSHLQERQKNCIACCNEIGKRSTDVGIKTVFHPNSPPGSVFRTDQDYEILINGLLEGIVDFAPDSGHIANGGMDVVTIFSQYHSRIHHVHFKDMDIKHQWAEMGQGIIDFKTIVDNLKKTGYKGWIMVEDESLRAEAQPDQVTIDNSKYLKEIGSIAS
jgi:inosose dehydratase